MKYKWKVDEPPTGFYRSFERRHWPSAHYVGGSPAAWLTCEDEYVPANVKEGKHAPLTLTVADYSITPTKENPRPWARRNHKTKFATLEEAKQAFKLLLQTHPELMPKQ